MQSQHYLFKRITIDPAICFGKPCIRGMRMPVASILDYLSSGMTALQLLKEFPSLEPEDISEALAFSASMMQDRFIVSC
ncbi:MAG: DUF433 domain-containing protein [Bacteroidetes bacterium]|nr:DUF433 domain-containing protein [Bacteroidota bacterium]